MYRGSIGQGQRSVLPTRLPTGVDEAKLLVTVATIDFATAKRRVAGVQFARPVLDGEVRAGVQECRRLKHFSRGRDKALEGAKKVGARFRGGSVGRCTSK